MKRLCWLIAAITLAGCGQNGELFLPPSSMQERVPAAETTTSSDENADNDNDNDNDDSKQ